MQDCCPACFIAISPGFFFGVWFRDRSFCDHFLQCDDLSSGVEKLSLGFFGACAALKGVWWMPWQTVPMKDV